MIILINTYIYIYYLYKFFNNFMKIFLLLFCISIQFTDEEKKQLEALDHYLYDVEDKIDHLLYHHGHDVTKHEA